MRAISSGRGESNSVGVALVVLYVALFLTCPAPQSHAGIAPTAPTYHSTWPTLGQPRGVAFDSQGNTYVASFESHRIRKHDPLGNLLLEWGSLGSGDGQLNRPMDIAVGASDVVYVVDSENDRIQRFTSSGVFLGAWGAPGTQPGQFDLPWGLALDAAGNVYVSDHGNDRVQKFTSAGAYLMAFGVPGSGPAQIDGPADLHVATNGTIYVADSQNGRIQYFDPQGQHLGGWSCGKALGIAGDSFGAIYVAELENHRIMKFSNTGTLLGLWGSQGSGAGQFLFPWTIALDLAGNMCILDAYSRVQKFSVSGAAFAHAGPAAFMAIGPGLVGTASTFFNPSHLATDASGNLWAVMPNQNRVFKLSSAGVFLHAIALGFASSADGQFNFPWGIAVNAAGDVYVSDRSNNRIQKFNNSGAFLLKWGSPGFGPGQFNGPDGIAVDAGGDVWVCEPYSGRIQRFTSTGVYVSQILLPNGDRPFDVDFGIDGNVYIQSDVRTWVYTPAGVPVREWPGAGYSIDVDARGFVHVYNSGVYRKYTNLGVQVASQPSTPLPLQNGFGIHIDAGGNIFMSYSQGVMKFADPPLIMRSSDVASDQGRVVRLKFSRTSAEAATTGVVTLGYAIQRRIEPLPGSAAAATGAAPTVSKPAAVPAMAGYDFAAYIPATGAASYEVDVATLANANPSSRYYSNFLVQAITSNPIWHFESAPEAVASIDDIPPPVVSPFTGVHMFGSNHLHWGVSSASDFAGFRLYKGGYAFTPSPGNMIAATTDTGWVDNAPLGSFKVTAVDFDGNESYPAALEAFQLLDAPGGVAPLVFALDGARPSPARGSRLEVHFTLPVAAPARLELYDIVGRRVASREVGSLGAGVHRVNLSESAGGRIASGLYFLRLHQGVNQRQVRVTVFE